MHTAVERLELVNATPKNQPPLFAVRASLNHVPAPDDAPLKQLLEEMTIISTLYGHIPRQVSEEPPLAPERHIIAVGPDPVPVPGRSIFGFLVRYINSRDHQIDVPEFSMDPTAPLSKEMYWRIGHTLFDALALDRPPEEDDYTVRISLNRISGVGRRILFHERALMRTRGSAHDDGKYIIGLGRLRSGGHRVHSSNTKG
jgi:hypothetical protein